jgi:Protein of unknown function (DUF2946)
LAVVLQILVPAIHHPVAALGQSFLFADSVICSASRMGSDRAVVPDKTPTRNPSHCPVCWGLQQLAGGFVVPGAISAPADNLGAGLANRLTDGTAILVAVPSQAAQPRGPPHLA